MAMLKGVEIHFVKCNPDRPNAKYNPKNPTWECQLRTTSTAVKKEWEALNLPVKAVIPEDGSPPFFRVNLRKKSIKEKDGTAGTAPEVKDGNLQPIDPDSIGNGSVANVRIYQYEYPKPDGTKGIASVLMGLQLTKHIVYTPKPRDDDFEQTTTERITPTTDDAGAEGDAGPPEDGEDSIPEVGGGTATKTPAPTPKPMSVPVKAVAGF